MISDKDINKTEPDKSRPASYSTRPPRPVRLSNNWNNRSASLNGHKLLSGLLLLLLVFVVGFGGGWLGARSYNHSPRGGASNAVKQQRISDESTLVASIAQTVGQGVVSVDVQTQFTTQDLFGGNQRMSQSGAGTGFIISAYGIIVTNRHVVPSGTTSVTVTLADGTRFDDVKVLGRTTEGNPLDIAFLKINNLKGHKLNPVTLGDSSQMQVGYRVIAIGNALGQFQNTVTSGIISGFGRDVVAGDQSGSGTTESLTDLFQTDAAINQGNSGGPLVNINGEVIGLNTAIAGNAQNIGFSIPINDVKGLINSVLSNGKLQQSYLGVHYVSLTDDLAYELNLPVKRGAYVFASDNQPAVIPGSPADKAGIKEKDIITKVDATNIDEKTSLTGALSKYKPGDKVKLTIVRNGKTTTIDATLGEAPQS